MSNNTRNKRRRLCTVIDKAAIDGFNKWFPSDEPKIHVIDNFLTKTELKELLGIVEGLNFSRSTVSNNQEAEYKTSKSAPLGGNRAIVTKLHDKIQRIMPGVQYETPLQVLKYSPGDICELHHDGCAIELRDAIKLDQDPIELGSPIELLEEEESNVRIMTGFLYLNDMKIDGEGCTIFPSLNTKIKPKAGRLLLFPNILRVSKDEKKLKMDDRVLHIGDKISVGTKYGINIWYKSKHQY